MRAVPWIRAAGIAAAVWAVAGRIPVCAAAAAAGVPAPALTAVPRPPLSIGEPWLSLAILLFFGALTAGLAGAARRGRRLPPLRPLPGLLALEDAVGRATELGRPVHLTGGIEDARSPQTIAAFGVLRYTAALAARYRTPLIVTSADPTVQAVNEAVVRRAYVEAGVPEGYNPDDIRYLSDSQFAYAGAITGIFRRERPAANILVGAFNAEAMVLIEAGAEAGALQIGATANTYQLPFFVAGCDHALIGEELFAAAAVLSGDREQQATLVAQDWAKIALIALILAGALAALF